MTDAIEVAHTVGFPVALKVVASGVLHKSDVGGVRLGLSDDDAVRRAYAAMDARFGAAMTGAVVQPMAPPGVELIVGVRNDAAFGPLVVVGMGGVTAELQRDSAVAVPPLTDVDVDTLIRSLRASPLLFGYRNFPPVDVAALTDLIARISQMAEAVDEIAELDCNPVVASPTGAVVLDARVRLVSRPDPPGPFALD